MTSVLSAYYWDACDAVQSDTTAQQAQKAFAAVAVKSPCSGVLFGLRAFKFDTIRKGLLGLGVDKLADLLRLEELESMLVDLTSTPQS